MLQFVWSMSISFQLLFIIVSGVLYYYIRLKTFKFYSLYNIFLLIYVLSRQDDNYAAFESFISGFLDKEKAETFVEVLLLYVQIAFYNSYTIFALYFLDLNKHTKKFFSNVIKILRILAISYLVLGIICLVLMNYSLYFNIYTFIYIPVMLVIFLLIVFRAVKFSGSHKHFFLFGASCFVVFALIAFAGSNISSLNIENPIIFFYVGIILETIFFSLGLAFKAKIYNDERNRVRASIVKHKHQQQISRFQGLILGEEKERKRLAEELHDGIAGDLTAIKFQLSTFSFDEATPENQNVIREVSRIIDSSYEQIREISHNLSPSSIINYGLIRTLESFSEKIEKTFKMKFTFEHSGENPPLSTMAQIHIYRIIQELVNNMIKHAEAKSGSIRMFYEKPKLKVIVSDDGKGFKRTEASEGIGMRNIDSRIKFLNAKFVKENSETGSKFIIELNTELIPNHGN